MGARSSPSHASARRLPLARPHPCLRTRRAMLLAVVLLMAARLVMVAREMVAREIVAPVVVARVVMAQLVVARVLEAAWVLMEAGKSPVAQLFMALVVA